MSNCCMDTGKLKAYVYDKFLKPDGSSVPPPPPPCEFVCSRANSAGSTTYFATDDAVSGQFYDYKGSTFYVVKDLAELRLILQLWDSNNAQSAQVVTGDTESKAVTANHLVTTRLTSLSSVLRNRVLFDQPIGSWDTSNVTNMAFAFSGAESFNRPIAGWDFSQVTAANAMFEGAFAFDQPLNPWDVSQVTDFANTFRGAKVFNRSLSDWDTRAARFMQQMFLDAESFDQDLSGWCVSGVPARPSNFDTGAAFQDDNAKMPVWGTCP